MNIGMYTLLLQESKMKMITDKLEFLMTISNIATLPYIDTEAKMMLVNALMQGHGVTWKPIDAVIIGTRNLMEFDAISAEIAPFVSTQDYFVYQVNTGFFGQFTFMNEVKRLLFMCMDFALMESGNRVNMAENNGPY